MTLNLKPIANPLEEQITELKQTADHHLTPFDVRLRRLLIQMYELLEDLQTQNRQLHNRIEHMSREIFEALEQLKAFKEQLSKIK
jgi:predicted RNase H-like nuclease (RuvC/YqgF family)